MPTYPNRDSDLLTITKPLGGGGCGGRGNGLDLPKGTSPAIAYLARLGEGSRRAQVGALRILVGLLAPGLDYDPVSFPWERVLPEQASLIRARLVKDYAPSTARRILSALKGVLKEAWRLGLLDRDRMERIVDLPAVKGSRPPVGRIVSDEEITRLLSVSAEHELYNLILLFGTGLRRHELAGATVGWNLIDGRWVATVSVTGKGGKARIVRVPSWWANQLAFLGTEERIGWPSEAVGRCLRRVAHRAGVSPFTAHDARRTYASRAFSAGVDIATIQKWMGHSDPKTTTSYDRRGEAEERELADRLTLGTEGVG